MSQPFSCLFHPKSTWYPSIPGFFVHLLLCQAINSDQIRTSSFITFSKKKHHWMEYCDCFLWFDWRNFQYFANGGYFLQCKRLEFIYWGPHQIWSWTFLHSIRHFIHSSALRFLQTKSSFKSWDYIHLLSNKIHYGIFQHQLVTCIIYSKKYPLCITKIFRQKREVNLIHFKQNDFCMLSQTAQRYDLQVFSPVDSLMW